MARTKSDYDKAKVGKAPRMQLSKASSDAAIAIDITGDDDGATFGAVRTRNTPGCTCQDGSTTSRCMNAESADEAGVDLNRLDVEQCAVCDGVFIVGSSPARSPAPGAAAAAGGHDSDPSPAKTQQWNDDSNDDGDSVCTDGHDNQTHQVYSQARCGLPLCDTTRALQALARARTHARTHTSSTYDGTHAPQELAQPDVGCSPEPRVYRRKTRGAVQAGEASPERVVSAARLRTHSCLPLLVPPRSTCVRIRARGDTLPVATQASHASATGAFKGYDDISYRNTAEGQLWRSVMKRCANAGRARPPPPPPLPPLPPLARAHAPCNVNVVRVVCAEERPDWEEWKIAQRVQKEDEQRSRVLARRLERDGLNVAARAAVSASRSAATAAMAASEAAQIAVDLTAFETSDDDMSFVSEDSPHLLPKSREQLFARQARQLGRNKRRMELDATIATRLQAGKEVLTPRTRRQKTLARRRHDDDRVKNLEVEAAGTSGLTSAQRKAMGKPQARLGHRAAQCVFRQV